MRQAGMQWLDTTDAGFEDAFRALLDDARETTAKVDAAVAALIAEVRAGGDAALIACTARFDRWTPADQDGTGATQAGTPQAAPHPGRPAAPLTAARSR